MIAIDTNVLVRWVRHDPVAPEQSALAQAALAEASGVHLNVVVLVEALWVLGARYRVDRAGLVRFVRALLAHSHVSIERRDVVAAALDAYERGGPGFSDHVIGRLNAGAGARTTLTFDKRAARADDFTLLA